MAASHLTTDTADRRRERSSPGWALEPERPTGGAPQTLGTPSPEYGHRFGQVHVTPSPASVQREGEEDMCVEGVPDPMMSGINPYGPTLPAPADPLAPTEFPEYPIDPVNPTIPKAPPLPNIPEPPPGGFPEAPPTPASPPAGGFWGALGSGIMGLGSRLINIFPPVPKKLLEDPFGTGTPEA